MGCLFSAVFIVLFIYFDAAELPELWENEMFLSEYIPML